MPQRAHDQMIELAHVWRPLEVGGVLTGYWNGDSAVITELVGPGERAVHKPETFLPDHDHHKKEIARIYNRSSGRDTYLGDWHSHPIGPDKLSPLDKRTLRSIALAKNARCPRPIMVLLSKHLPDWTVLAFTLGDERRFRPRKIVGMRIEVF